MPIGAADVWALPKPHFDWRENAAVAILAVGDWIVIALCLAAAWRLREAVLRSFYPALPPLHDLPLYVENLCYLLPWTLAFAREGLYTRRLAFWEEARRIVWACTVGAMFAALLSFATRSSREVSRLVIAQTWLATLLVVPLARYGLKRLLTAVGLWQRPILILGAGDTGMRACNHLRMSPETGFHPVAFVDDDPGKIGTTVMGLPVRGPLARTPEVVRAHDARELLLTMPRLPRERLQALILACEGQVESIRLVPDFVGVGSTAVEAEEIDGLLLLHTRWNLARPSNIALKRGFDLVAAAVVAILTLPLLALVALLIRLESDGPALFVQERLGRGGRTFRVFKFRTMYEDAEARLQAHIRACPEAREEWAVHLKLRSDDPRITRVGRVLRTLSIDELPQVFNVLAGKMSLVGPRPYLEREIPRMGAVAQTILKAPPGITGLWQTSGRSDLSFEQRLRLDEYYVRNWSLWMDLIVLVKTVAAVLSRRGAY